MEPPFLQFDIAENAFYKEPYIAGGFAGSQEGFNNYLANHEKETLNKSGSKSSKFPSCCKFHQHIYDNVKKAFDAFPNREIDIKYQNNPFFKKSTYAGLPLKVAASIIITQYHIDEKVKTDDWYNDITEYIEYVVDSFGSPAVFFDYYINYLVFLLKNSDGTDHEEEAYKKLLEFIDAEYCKPKEKVEPADLNSLYATYENWLATFPFNISYFTDLKQGFEKGFFTILLNNQKTNRYTGIFCARPKTQTELIEVLINTTKDLLAKIDAVDLFEKGLIKDTKKHTLDLKKKDLKIKNDLLLGKFSTGEIEYLNILKEWLSYQKDFFRDIALFIVEAENKIEDHKPEKTKAELLKSEFKNLGFENLVKIKGKLSEKNIESLFEQLTTNKTPYQIAMLQNVGFIELLCETRSKEKVYTLLANSLGSKTRIIKGNCLVLNPQSSESRKTFTSHLHTIQVEKDYQKLKLG